MDARACGALFDGEPPADETDLEHRAKVDAGRCETESASVSCEEVEERVGGAVIALCRCDSLSRDGTDHDEGVKRYIKKGIVQVPGPSHLGIDGIVPAVYVVAGEETVLLREKGSDTNGNE